MRLQAGQDALIREVGDVKQDMRQQRMEMRTHFVALIVLIVTMWVSVTVALMLRT